MEKFTKPELLNFQCEIGDGNNIVYSPDTDDKGIVGDDLLG